MSSAPGQPPQAPQAPEAQDLNNGQLSARFTNRGLLLYCARHDFDGDMRDADPKCMACVGLVMMHNREKESAMEAEREAQKDLSPTKRGFHIYEIFRPSQAGEQWEITRTCGNGCSHNADEDEDEEKEKE
jgi:hypothetical protein